LSIINATNIPLAEGRWTTWIDDTSKLFAEKKKLHDRNEKDPVETKYARDKDDLETTSAAIKQYHQEYLIKVHSFFDKDTDTKFTTKDKNVYCYQEDLHEDETQILIQDLSLDGVNFPFNDLKCDVNNKCPEKYEITLTSGPEMREQSKNSILEQKKFRDVKSDETSGEQNVTGEWPLKKEIKVLAIGFIISISIYIIWHCARKNPEATTVTDKKSNKKSNKNQDIKQQDINQQKSSPVFMNITFEAGDQIKVLEAFQSQPKTHRWEDIEYLVPGQTLVVTDFKAATITYVGSNGITQFIKHTNFYKIEKIYEEVEDQAEKKFVDCPEM
jgi:hypothetical protein